MVKHNYSVKVGKIPKARTHASREMCTRPSEKEKASLKAEENSSYLFGMDIWPMFQGLGCNCFRNIELA